jgi:DNA-binding MarR family transcriptional regulator
MANTRTDTPIPSGCTCLRLRKAARRITQIYDQQMAAHGLTITQYGLLTHLKRHDGIGIGALAEELVMDPTTLTRNLRPLERAGLMQLVPDPHDRRSRRLHLTADGRAVLEKARPAWARAQRHVEEALGTPDTAVLHAALDRVLRRLGP